MIFTKEEIDLKRFTALLLSFLLCLSAIPTFGTVDTYYDGNKIALSNSVTLYPALELLKILGADIEMKGNDFTAILNETTISYDSYYEELYIGDDYYYAGDKFQVIEDTLYFPASLLKEIAPVDYTEKNELNLLSEKALTAQKARNEKKFKTMYPRLSKALNDLPNSNFEQNMTLKMILESSESMEESPQIKLNAIMAQDAKNDTYHYKLNLETSEYGSVNKESKEIIILEDAIFTTDGSGWSQESMEDREDIKFNIDMMPFFFNHVNHIEEERISGGIAYTIKLDQAPISILLDLVGEQYAETLQIEDIDEDYNALLKDLEWRIVVNYKGQLLENTFKGNLSMYDSWSEETILISMDLDATYDMTKELLIESPLKDYKSQTPIDFSKLKIKLNNQNFTPSLDLKEVDKTLFIKASDLNKIMDVTNTGTDYSLKISTDDVTLEVEEYSDEIIVNDAKFLSSRPIFIEGDSYYLPLKSVTEFLGGLCIVDREAQRLSLYTPDYLKSTYANKNLSSTTQLKTAIGQLTQSTFRADRSVMFKIDNYVNYAGDRYDDYDLSHMNIQEVEFVDPLNKSLTSSRTVNILGDAGDLYDMELRFYEDNFYYTFIEDDEEAPYWYKNENVSYERLVHDELVKFQKIAPYLKPLGKTSNTFTYKTLGEELSQEEKIFLARMVYDGFVMDHLYLLPIDSISLKEIEVTYTMKANGQIESKNESYLFKFDDGQIGFDVILTNKVAYSEFNQPVNVSAPEITE